MSSVTLSDIAAVFSLILSGYAVWVTLKFNERQVALMNTQKRLNELLIRQGQDVDIETLRADMGANIIRLGSSQHRLRIFNKGKSAAKDIQIEFPDGNDLVLMSDFNDKFPMEILETHQSVDLIAAVHWGTKRKHAVRITWSDQNSPKNEKTVYVTL